MKYRMIVLFFLFCSLVFSEENKITTLKKPTVRSVKYFDANRIKTPIMNNATFARHPISGNSDFRFDEDYLIYTSGLWMAANVNGEIRASASDFNTDFVGGAIDESGNPFGKEDSTFRVYKISRGDNAATNIDYAQWPIDLGAPADGQGNPLFIGDQTLWCCFTDAFVGERIWYNICKPLGAEIHLTAWGWGDIDNVIFMRWEIINKSQDVWEDAYFGLFSDPDVGDANNDLTGSDSTLNLVYCYDSIRESYYYLPQHAVGYLMLESPMVVSIGDTAFTFFGKRIDYQNVPIYSPRIEKHSQEGWGEGMYLHERTALIIYNRLQCLNYDGDPAIDPTTNLPTKWAYSGDPVIGAGWIDNQISPRDRRMMVSTGPLNVAPSDTSSMMLAIIAVQNDSRLGNIIDVKHNARFLMGSFKRQFKIYADAIANVNYLSPTESEVVVNVPVKCEANILQVQAAFFNYDGNKIYTFELFDDGAHSDGAANDYIFGNTWLTEASDDPLYLNLSIIDETGKDYYIEHAAEYITLSNKLDIVSLVVADSKNYDGEANPGENIRLTFGVYNNYDFDLKNLNISASIADSFFITRTEQYFIDTLAARSYGQTEYLYDDPKTYLTFTIPEYIPTNHKIGFEVDIYDLEHHHWLQKVTLPVKPFDYFPNEIIPSQISGKSDAYFVIRIVAPNRLTGHTYTLTASDSLPDGSFNLYDQTLNIPLLSDHPLPDEYAYNVPVTDGFKVVEAYIPEGGLTDAYYEDVEGGHPDGFEGVNYGGQFFNGGVILGQAPEDNFYNVEIEFTNDIDTSGIVGTTAGQGGFRYLLGASGGATSFVPCPFNIWKIFKGERIGRLNACFQENQYFPTNDTVWAPDASAYGGFEILNIMTTEYEPTGRLYMGKELDMNEVMYRCVFRLISENSVVDAGDKFVLKWEHLVTIEDRWVFIPTNVKQEYTSVPMGFILYQNYPNPFNNSTRISFYLENSNHVMLTIYNVQGQKVKTLFVGIKSVGSHELNWDGRNEAGEAVASGLYLCRLKTKDHISTKKMLLLK